MNVFSSLPIVGSWFRPVQPIPLFDSHSKQTDPRVSNATESAWNRLIASQLPSCTFKSARLTKEKGKCVLNITFRNTSTSWEEKILFQDETTLHEWLANRSDCDIWEIKDLRKEKPTFLYKLHNNGAWGYTNLSQEELFSCLTEEFGILFRFNHLDTGKAHFFCTKDATPKKPFQEVFFDDLFYLAQALGEATGTLRLPLKPLFHSSKFAEKHKGKLLLLTLLPLSNATLTPFLTSSNLYSTGPDLPLWAAGALGSIALSPLSYSASSSHAAACIVFSSMWGFSRAQNNPPDLIEEFSNIVLNVGDSFEVENIVDHFEDPDGHVLFPDIAAKPGFVMENFTAGTLRSHFSTGGFNQVFVNATTKILYAFPSYEPFQVWNVSDPNNPQPLGTYTHGDLCGNGVVHAFSAFLSCFGGLRVVDISNLLSPSPVTVFPGSYEFIALQETENIIWINERSGPLVYGVDISNPGSPAIVSSFNNTETARELHISENGLLFIPYGYQQGTRILDVTNTTYPQALETIPSGDIPLGVSTLRQSPVTYIDTAERFNGFSLYVRFDGFTPVLVKNFDEGSNSACAISSGGGAVIGSYCSAGQQEIVIIRRNPSPPQIVGRFPLSETPASTFSLNNWLYIPTANGMFIYDILGLSLYGTPQSGDQGVHTVTPRVTDGIGGTHPRSFTITVLNRDPFATNPIGNQTASYGNFFAFTPNTTEAFGDPDEDPIHLSGGVFPNWLALVNNTFSGTPTVEHLGPHIVIATGTDGFGGFANNTFFIEVIPPPTEATTGSTIPTSSSSTTTPSSSNPSSTASSSSNPSSMASSSLSSSMNPSNSTPATTDSAGTSSHSPSSSSSITHSSSFSSSLPTDISSSSSNVPTSSSLPTSEPSFSSSLPPSSSSTEPTAPAGNSSSSEGNNTLTIVIIVVAGVVIAVGIGGGAVILTRRGRNGDRLLDRESIYNGRASSIASFELQPIEKQITSVFGQGQYGWLDLSQVEERKSVCEETGLVIPEKINTGSPVNPRWVPNEKGVFGKGNFGEIRICWKMDPGCYFVAKVVEGEANCTASEKEANTQKTAAEKSGGEGIWPIQNTIRDPANNRLIHLMEPAGLGSVDNVYTKLTLFPPEDRSTYQTIYAQYIAHDIGIGLYHLHRDSKKSPRIFHLDLKGANVLVSKEGKIGITDFGCAKESTTKFIYPGDGDYRYRAPEGLFSSVTRKPFCKEVDGAALDMWSLGALLLEFMKEKPIVSLLNLPVPNVQAKQTFFETNDTLEKLQETIQDALNTIPELKNPETTSIYFVIKNLLQIDPKQRWTAEQMLKADHFKQFKENSETRVGFFSKLSTYSSARKASPTSISSSEKEEAYQPFGSAASTISPTSEEDYQTQPIHSTETVSNQEDDYQTGLPRGDFYNQADREECYMPIAPSGKDPHGKGKESDDAEDTYN